MTWNSPLPTAPRCGHKRCARRRMLGSVLALLALAVIVGGTHGRHLDLAPLLGAGLCLTGWALAYTWPHPRAAQAHMEELLRQEDLAALLEHDDLLGGVRRCRGGDTVMTRYLRADGKIGISWDDESEPVDWTTPNVGDGIDDEYCGNCAWDAPGCGCPRDRHYDGSDPRTLPVQRREDPPLPARPARAPLCAAHRDDCPNGPAPHAYHPPELEGLPCCRQPGEEVRR